MHEIQKDTPYCRHQRPLDPLGPFQLDCGGIHLMFIRCSTYAKMGTSPPCVPLMTDYVATGRLGRLWTLFTKVVYLP